jgi:hypothetical protein
MKKILLLVALVWSVSSLVAQNSNMIIFSEQGEGFYLIVNGIRQNSTPQTNVRVTGLNAPSYKVKVVFQNENLGEFDKNIYFHTQGLEYTYTIKLNRKGKYTLRYVSEAQIAQHVEAPGQTEIVYTTVEAPIEDNATSVTTTTTTTSTTHSGDVNNPNVNMQVNIGGAEMGMNVNMNVNDGSANATYSETTTVTTTTTSSSTTHTSGSAGVYTEEVVYVDGYNGNIGCDMPMNDADYRDAKQSIASKSFEDTKLTMAKQIADANCLTAEQVRGILKVFTFEDSKLEFAKYCYSHTYDLGNYYKVNDAFQFESSIEELNEYIRR